MGSTPSKPRPRGRSPRSVAREQLAFREPPHRPRVPKPPNEPIPLPILDWPIRPSRSSEDAWLPGWQGPRLPAWLLWIPVEVARGPDHPEPRVTTRTAYIRCLENRAMCWHSWRYPQKREFDLWYAVDRAKEAELVSELNDVVYAQRELLRDEWESYEIIPEESDQPVGPAVDGTVPRRIPKIHRRRLLPYWMFYPAGLLPYEWLPDTDPDEVWLAILQRRGEKWAKWQFPGRRSFRERFERYEPDGRGGATQPRAASETSLEAALEPPVVETLATSMLDPEAEDLKKADELGREGNSNQSVDQKHSPVTEDLAAPEIGAASADDKKDDDPSKNTDVEDEGMDRRRE